MRFFSIVENCLQESSNWMKAWMDPNGIIHPLEELGGDDHDDWAQEYLGFDSAKAMSKGWVRLLINRNEMVVVNDLKKLKNPQIQSFMTAVHQRGIKTVWLDGPDNYDVFLGSGRRKTTVEQDARLATRVRIK